LIKEKTEYRWVKGLEERYEKMLLDNKQLKEEVAMLKQKYVVIRQNMPGYDFT